MKTTSSLIYIIPMMSPNGSFVTTTVTDESNACDIQEFGTETDPFADVNNDVEAVRYYRLNEKVFAEPLEIKDVGNSPGECVKESPAELTFVGNIGVQKRPGKRNKYFIDIEDVTNLTCPQENCKKQFTSTTLLKAHIRKIHCADRNSYVCEQCGAGFPAQYLLRRHSAVHGDRKVECPVCHKMLSLRTNLSTHLRSHSSSRPHRCRCGKRFVRQSALRRHERFVHTNR